jgi:hypothetical protein
VCAKSPHHRLIVDAVQAAERAAPAVAEQAIVFRDAANSRRLAALGRC